VSKIRLCGHIVVPESDLAAVRAELPRHIELTRQEAGCLVFEVTQDAERHNVFHVFEEFFDRPAFEAHQARSKGSRWGRASANVERHYRIEEQDRE